MTTKTASKSQGEPHASAMLRLEDTIGKVLLTLVFLWQLYGSSLKTIINVRRAVDEPGWWLTVVANVTTVGFVGLIVWLTVTRKPPVDVAQGIEARFSAFMGTFVLMLLILAPPRHVSVLEAGVATTLILLGTASSIYVLWWLGRAFSVVASARELVTGGPYSIVRHPLYATEAVTVIGVVLINGTLLALGLGIVQFAFQFRRMRIEEAVLERALPGYADYKARTAMIIPGVL